MAKNQNLKYEEQRDHSLLVLEDVRASASNGAANVLGHPREDVRQDIASAAVQKFIQHRKAVAEGKKKPIRNPRAWAFRVGRTGALRWIKLEQRVEEFLVKHEAFEGGEADVWSAQGPSKAEVLNALPELFELFQNRVVKRLRERDRLFFERFYVDKWSEEQLAQEFHLKPKHVKQRWARLVRKLHAVLRKELRAWHRGEELFGQAFCDPKNLVGLLCLIALFLKKGIGAIKDLLDSVRPN